MSASRVPSRAVLAWLAAITQLAWVSTAASQPGTLSNHSAIYDPARQSMILFGGAADAQVRVNDVWRLQLGPDPQWSLIQTSGAAPSARLGHTAVLDPVRDRMIVFGGIDANLQILGDAWAFSLSDSTWTPLTPLGTPPPARGYHTAIYDPVRDRMVVFGGEHAFGSYLNDVWSLWLSPTPRWERIFPTGPQPFPRFGQSAIYDPVRDRMLVFGSNLPTNDLWALTFGDTTWSILGTTGTPPAARSGHSAIYDAVNDRMVVFGGFDNNQYLDDVWLLSLASAPLAWSPFVGSPRPTVRGYHSAIYDSAYARMIVFGGANVTDLTWALSLDAGMRWFPEHPVVDVSPTSLSLPTVTVGDTVSASFSVGNGGLQPLAISAFSLSTPALRISGPGPAPLPWNTALRETLTLAASTPGVTDDSLVIVSDDPLTPRRRIDLHLDVRALDFSTHILDEPDSVPPGVFFIVVVTPQPGVVIERGKLFYRIADGSSPFDSLALTHLATDFIAAIPATAVTERGVDYFVRVENSGFAAHQPAGAPAEFFTQKVAAPAAIVAVIPRPTSGADFLAGEPIEVDVELPDGTLFDSGTLSYRRGGESSFQSLPLAPTVISGQVAAVIPDSMVGPRGLEYRVSVQTLRSTLEFPVTGSVPASIRTRVPNLVEPAVHPGGRYRLLSVPLDFGADFSGSLDALLADQLGSYDPTRWRAFLYDPATQANIEFSASQAPRFRPEPGRATWLISRDAHRVDTKPIAGFSTPSDADYPITLAPGWNMIGDPFDFPVAWSEVGGDTAFTDDAVAFDPGLGSIGDYSDVTPTVLAPFAGYFVHATQAATLLIPHRAAPTTSAATAARAQDLGWRARLAASTAESEDAANTIGFAEGSSSGFDALDLLKPPVPPGPWVRLALVHPDWGRRAGEYRRDLRPPGSAGESWEIEVRSASHGEVVTLELSELAPGAEAACVLDCEQGTSVAWPRGTAGARASLAFRIGSFGTRPYRLALVAGSEAYVADAVRQASLAALLRLALDPAAPNPFTSVARIRFGLPKASRVTLRVYGLQGERVATLLDGAALEAGYHSLLWDGQTAAGSRAASGVYLARLDADGVSLTRRMILVR